MNGEPQHFLYKNICLYSFVKTKLLLFLGWGYSTGGSQWAAAPAGRKLGLTQD